MKARHGTLILVLAILAPAAAGWAEVKPPTNPLCTFENGRYRVDFLRASHCCPNVLEFWVENLESGRQGRISVATQIRQTGKMSLVADSKILVTGLLERDAKAIVVVDLESGELQDELHTFDYRLSPSQRHFVYSRRPAHRAEANQLLLLYDVTASAEDNRAGWPVTLDISNAGRPVYPESNAREGSYVSKPEEAFRLLSPLYWSEDESRVVFFETFEERFHLVTLDFSEGYEAPRVRKKELALAELAQVDAEKGSKLPIGTLRWKDANTVELSFLLGGIFHDGVAVDVP